MESSLHRQLKRRYSADETEVRVGAFRVDAIRDGELVEVQRSSLSALRDKLASLLEAGHRVRVVKPLVARKRLVKLTAADGDVTARRWSPRRQTPLDAFDELVHLTRVFPHPRLVVELLMVEIEERRYPGHGKRRRRREADYQVEDRRLLDVQRAIALRAAADLVALLPPDLASPFDTAELAAATGTRPPFARKIAYTLRETGAVEPVGTRGNARLYALPEPASRR